MQLTLGVRETPEQVLTPGTSQSMSHGFLVALFKLLSVRLKEMCISVSIITIVLADTGRISGKL